MIRVGGEATRRFMHIYYRILRPETLDTKSDGQSVI
jgi:hypothetical protein